MKKSVRESTIRYFVSIHYEQKRNVSHRCVGAEVHFRISRQYPIRLHQLGQSTRRSGESARRDATRRDETRMFLFFLFYQSRGKFDGARKSTRGRGKQIKRIYTTARVDRNREVETGSRQRYTLSFPLLFLSFSRESQFSLQPSGHGSIAGG